MPRFTESQVNELDSFLRDNGLVLMPFLTDDDLWTVHLFHTETGRSFHAWDILAFEAINMVLAQFWNVKMGRVN